MALLGDFMEGFSKVCAKLFTAFKELYFIKLSATWIKKDTFFRYFILTSTSIDNIE